MAGGFHRLYVGETTIDFFGRRRLGFFFSGALFIVAVVSLLTQGLNLGIDFKGGVSFEAPASAGLTVESAREALTRAGVDGDGAKIQTLTSSSGSRLRIQLGDLPRETVDKVKTELATAGSIDVADVSTATVSSTWGRNITDDAIRALLFFLGLVSLFIAWRFEWAMAAGALAAVVHDIVISVGVYSVLQLEVTPATVVAFLTILGYSLYDTIVVFDKIDDNVERFSGSRVSYGDIVNVSMNQVLMRSLNTSISSVLPVLSLLVLGSVVMGATALQEFAVALLVGLATGAYSSIFIATPLLGILKERSARYRTTKGELSLGADMAHLMSTGAPAGRRTHQRRADAVPAGSEGASAVARTSVDAILSHPPRPRKKARR